MTELLWVLTGMVIALFATAASVILAIAYAIWMIARRASGTAKRAGVAPTVKLAADVEPFRESIRRAQGVSNAAWRN